MIYMFALCDDHFQICVHHISILNIFPLIYIFSIFSSLVGILVSNRFSVSESTKEDCSRDKSVKIEDPCHSWNGTVKIPPSQWP